MIIGACGFGSTGSSVITDYLREFDNVSVNDKLEMTWIYQPDGLLDLERAVMHPHSRTSDSRVAIERYLKRVDELITYYENRGLDTNVFKNSAIKFIDEITTTSWYSPEKNYPIRSRHFIKGIMLHMIIPRIERRIGKYADCWPLKKVRISVKAPNFYIAAQKHVDEILKGFGLDQEGIVALDQPFAGNAPQLCFPFFKDPYAIVVDRDPRDNYVFARTRMLGRFHYMPINKVEDFIAYYRAIRKDQLYLEDNSRILRIHFEDMVYEYEKTTTLVRDFLGLPENPRPKSVFAPELSIANTQVFRRFKQFEEDIKVIEKELPEYLYDYSGYPEPDLSKKMFFGKSPLNEGFRKDFSE